tara:strand:- start:775 stop:2265 length:1491 start_codon:yes stop_codon:yes gene_type:complete
LNAPNGLPVLPEMNQPLQRPSSCPLTAELVGSLILSTQAPPDLILIGVLSTYSILSQGLINAERPGVGVGPPSLYTIGISDSGERKSTVFKKLLQPIVEFQKRQNDEHAQRLAYYEAEAEVFDEALKILKKKISDRLKKGLSVEELTQQLGALKREEPMKPKNVQLIFEDATTEAIARELSEGWGSAALVSDEGATILNGRIAQDLPRINKLWAADPFAVNRASSDSFTVEDARLTLAIMAQPSAIDKFMKKRGDESLGIGFLARFLVCNPSSTQGSRFLTGSFEGDEDGYKNYLKRANEILRKVKSSIEDSGTQKKVIRFSEEAKHYWIDLYNRIEANLQVNGRFQHARDHGSKLAENIARIAALLSYIEYGEDEPIPLGVLMDAETMGFYFSDVFLRYFQSLPEYLKDVSSLRDHFESVREDGRRYLRKNRIRQSGPSRMRDKYVLNYTLDSLMQFREISILVANSGMVIVDLYPGFPHDAEQWRIFCIENEVK